MDLSAFPQIASITVICFVIGQALKTIDRLPTKYIPAIILCGGLLLGLLGHLCGAPGLVDANVLDAMAIGAISGLGSSGIYSAYQNLAGKYESNNESKYQQNQTSTDSADSTDSNYIATNPESDDSEPTI